MQTSKQEKDWIEIMVDNLSVIPKHTRLPYARNVIKRHTPKVPEESPSDIGEKDNLVNQIECMQVDKESMRMKVDKLIKKRKNTLKEKLNDSYEE